MNPPIPPIAEAAVTALRRELGENLYSVSLYGSTVRGGAVEGVSDVNLLIVLKHSDAPAHEAVARAIGGEPKIAPFILGVPGFERSVRAFAAKFASLKRWHRVLHGEDVLARVEIPEHLERFLCEQALRNLRLRTAHSFVLNARHHGYGQHLKRVATEVVLRFSDVVRLSGVDLPARPEDRIPILERELGIDGKTLQDLLALRGGALPWRESEAQQWHSRVFGALDSVLRRIEQSWPEPG